MRPHENEVSGCAGRQPWTGDATQRRTAGCLSIALASSFSTYENGEYKGRTHAAGDYFVLSCSKWGIITAEMLADGLAVDDRSKPAREVAHIITAFALSIMKWLRDSLNGTVSSSLRSGCNGGSPSRATGPCQR